MRTVPILGNGGVIAEVNSDAALRIVHRPNDYASNGVYMITVGASGINGGIGAGSWVFSFRWTHASKLALVRQFTLGVSQEIAVAGGGCQMDLFFGRSFTASPTGGSTATMTGDNNALRTSMAASQAADIRWRPNGGTVSAGTVTLDTIPIASAVWGFSGTAQIYGFPLTDLIYSVGEGSHPIVLAQNEGIVLKGTVANITTTWTVTMKWAEVDSY